MCRKAVVFRFGEQQYLVLAQKLFEPSDCIPGFQGGLGFHLIHLMTAFVGTSLHQLINCDVQGSHQIRGRTSIRTSEAKMCCGALWQDWVQLSFQQPKHYKFLGLVSG